MKYIFRYVALYFLSICTLEACRGNLYLLLRFLFFSLIFNLTLNVWQSISWIITFKCYFFTQRFLSSHILALQDSEVPERAWISSVSSWGLNASEGCEDRMHSLWETTFIPKSQLKAWLTSHRRKGNSWGQPTLKVDPWEHPAAWGCVQAHREHRGRAPTRPLGHRNGSFLGSIPLAV